MPGRIMEAISRSGAMNPLLLLDEIDKLGSDYRGDPASALLEVLDSEQNHAFRDHFLEIPLDLSQVHVHYHGQHRWIRSPGPCWTGWRSFELSSYTDEEKLQIAKNHLLPKQMKEHGLKKAQPADRRGDPAGHHSRLHPGIRRPRSWSGSWPPSAERRICSCCRRL